MGLPTASQITNFYLYGDILDPSDKTAIVLRPEGVSSGIVYVDIKEFMAGPGRFANPSKSALIEAFFDGGNYIPAGTYKKSQLAQLLGVSSYGIDIAQWQYDDGLDNYVERAYVWNNTQFQIDNRADFVVGQNGHREIRNLGITPREGLDGVARDDFDFLSSGLGIIANMYLKPRVDPSGIGRTVDILFSGEASIKSVFTRDDYVADKQSSVAGNAINASDLATDAYFGKLISGLFASGSIRFLDSRNRPIIYGSQKDDSMAGSVTKVAGDLNSISPLSEHPLKKFLINGITYVAGNGDDTIQGGKGSDALYGQNGDDSLNGGDGNDWIEGGADSDSLRGGVGNDVIDGGSGIDLIYGEDGHDKAIGGAGNDQIYGGIGNDLIDGGADNDIAYGENGSDSLYGGIGNDSLFGGDDDDLLQGWDGADYLDGEAGTDRLNGGAGVDLLFGGSGNDALYGDADDDSLTGGTGNDWLDGGSGFDVYHFKAGDGNDVIVDADGAGRIEVEADGSSGVFTLSGGQGVTSAGQWKQIVGGHTYTYGFDPDNTGVGNLSIRRDDGTLSLTVRDFQNGRLGITLANLPVPVVTPPANAGDSGSEYAYQQTSFDAKGGNDVLITQAGADTIDGGDGNEYIVSSPGSKTIMGGDGADFIETGSYYKPNAPLSELQQSSNWQSGWSDWQLHLLGSQQHQWSRSLKEVLSGQTLAQYERTWSSQVFYEITSSDARGWSWVSNVAITDPQTFNGGLGNDTIDASDSGGTVSGDEGDDWLYGGETADTLMGGIGNDLLYANPGDDLVNGGNDDDFIDGNDGNDMLYGGAGADTLLGDGVENGIANRDDLIDGGDGDDVVDGGGGNDKIFGGKGDDVLFAASIYDPDALENNLVDGGDGADKIVGAAGGDTLIGGAGNDMISGSGDAQATGSDDDLIFGNEGDDLVVADGGHDVVYGGTGNDSLHGDNGAYAEALHGNDLMSGEAGNDSLLGYGGDDTLFGGDDNDTVQGMSGQDSLDGGAGIDLLTGGDGNDQLYGGDGNDGFDGTGTQRVANGGALRGGNGNDSVYGGAGQDGLMGEDGNDMLFGDDGDDQLDGGAGNDVLSGGIGDDAVIGMDGSDVLEGGAGTNLLNGGAGNDTYIYSGGIDAIVDSGGADSLVLGGMSKGSISLKQVGSQLQIVKADGTGVVIEGGFSGTIEQFKFGDLMVPLEDLMPDELAASEASAAALDIVSAPESDSDELDLRHFLRLGKESFNLIASSAGGALYGGGANDTIWGSQGNDSLYGAAGNDAIDGGLSGSNYLDGEEGDDTLDGGSGSDTLVGGTGNDLLRGSAGADVYVFASGFGQDTIRDRPGFCVPVNVIRFSDPVDLNSLTLSRSQLNVTFAFANGDQLTVENFFAAPTYSNFNIEFADGTVWTTDEIKQRVQVLATEGNDNLSGWETDNYIDGKGGNDSLYGGSGQDTLIGGAGNDSLMGLEGNDVFIGGDGYDTIDGGSGDDTYVHLAGTITDTICASIDEGNNTIQIDGAIAGLTIVRPYWDRKDLLIGVCETPNNPIYITLDNVFDTNSRVGTYTIRVSSTGETLSWADIQRLMLVPTAGNNTLWGTSAAESIHGAEGNDDLHGWAGNDTLAGEQGLDTLEGGLGDDLYLIERGQGLDVITEEGGLDTLRIGTGVAPGQVVLRRIGDALYLASQDGALQASISSHFKLTNSLRANAIETIEFADGTSWSLDQIDAPAIVTTADTMAGTSGNDTFIFDNNADVITEQANAGIDVVRADQSYWLGENIENAEATGCFDLSLTGNGLNNSLIGNVAANILDGGTGIDTLIGGNGDDTYYALDTGDVVIENANEGHDSVHVIYGIYNYVLPDNIEDVILRYGSSRSLTGNALDNVIDATEANSGISYLDGGIGNDTMYGSRSSIVQNIFVVDSVGDKILFRNGSDAKQNTVRTSLEYVLPKEIDNIQLTGSANISAIGNAADNVMDGSTSNGSNTLRGGVGNDTYRIDLRDVVIENESEGSDTIILDDPSHQSGMTIRLSDYPNIENFTWCGGNDEVLYGTAGDNRLSIAGNATTIYAGDGNDSASAINVFGGNGSDVLSGYFVAPGAGNDAIYLTGNQFQNSVLFNRGDGQDVITAPGGEIVFGSTITLDDLVFTKVDISLQISVVGSDDSILLGAQYNIAAGGMPRGIDTIRFADDPNSDMFIPFGAIYRSVTPTISGTNQDDLLTRSANPENATLDALEGDDWLIGSRGSERLIGGAGSDEIYGSYGVDTYQYSVGDGVDWIYDSGVNPYTGGDEVNWLEFGDGISAESLVMSSSGYQGIISLGDTGQIVLMGLMQPGGRAFMGVRFVDGSVITPEQLIDMCRKIVGTSDADSLEGSDSSDEIHGLAGNDTLRGNAGNDTLDGGDGLDRLEGGGGNDRYLISSGDTVYELADVGVDTVVADFGYTLPGNVENLVLSGSAAINATGNSLGNYLLGNSGANVLDGKTGVDTLEGGAGNDTYVVDNAGDVVTENANEGTDLVNASITFSLANFANVENLTLTGSSAINAAGNASNNTLTGNSGANVLDGGAGNDTMVGGAGNDTYLVDGLSDVVTEASSAGNDTIQANLTYTLASLANVENLTLTGTAAINATGNTAANRLTGNSGDNRLDGGSGNDTMLGGAGNDTYVFNVATDVVTENANEGIDTIETGVTLSIASVANVENITLTGTSAISATGNLLDNVLKGNSANNKLTGGAGNDRLDGGAGNDTMLGGTGNDTYVVNVSTDVVTENANEGTDTVESSITYTVASLANLENISLTGSTAINATGNAAANALIGNSGVNVLTGGAGNDTLDGAAGNDSLMGGTGNDTYVLGRGYGADTVTENDSTAGNTDVASFMAGVSTDQIWFRKVNTNDLEVSVIGTSDKLTLKSWYLGNQYHVEQFKTADNKLLVDTDVQKLVDAMAAFAPPAAGQTTLPSNYQTSLSPILAANWH